MMGRMAAKPPSMHDVTALSQCLGTSCGMDGPVVHGINPGSNCKGSGQWPGTAPQRLVTSRQQDKARSGLLSVSSDCPGWYTLLVSQSFIIHPFNASLSAHFPFYGQASVLFSSHTAK